MTVVNPTTGVSATGKDILDVINACFDEVRVVQPAHPMSGRCKRLDCGENAAYEFEGRETRTGSLYNER